MIHVIATLTAHPGKADAVVEAAQACIAGTRGEAGCITYDLYRKTDAADGLVFVEVWESREHLQAHFATPHIKAFQAAISGLLAKSVVEVIHPKRVEVL